MVQRRSVKRQRELVEFGAHLRRWRKLRGMTALELADRASITRETLRNLETGTGSPRLDSLFAAMGALGITQAALDGVSPFNSTAARARMDEILAAGGEL